MTDERRVQLAVDVDASGARSGFNEVRSAADGMAGAVERSGDQASRAVEEIGQAATGSSRQMSAAERSMIGSIQRATAALEAGSRSGSRYYEVLGSQRGIDPRVLQPYLDQLRAVEAAQARSTEALNQTRPALDQVGNSAAQTAAAMRGVPAQFTDIITSLQGGQGPLTVFLQQGGQLRDTFGSAGEAARALGTYVAGLINPLTVGAAAVALLAAGYSEGSKEADAYNRALALTGNIAGTTSERLTDMARNISQSVGTQGKAAAALAEMAGSGKIGADNLERFGAVALQLEKTVGRSVAETVKDLSMLAEAPLEASKKLNDEYHYLTAAVYDQIRALEEQGRADEAAAVAQTAYADAFEERSKKLEARLGAIEKGWRAIKSAATETWDAIVGVGREETTAQKLERASNVLSFKRSGLAQREAEGKGDDRISQQLRDDIAKAEKYKATLDAQVDAENRLLAIESGRRELDEADIKWKEQGLKLLSKEQQMRNEIDDARKAGEAAGYSDADIDARIALIKKKYGELNNAGTAALEAQRNVEREMLAGQMAALDSARKQQLVGETDYYAAKRDLQLKDLGEQEKLLKKQAQLAGGKADLAEREKYLGELRVLEQRRANIIQSAQNSIDEAAAATRRAVNDQLATWTTATANELAQLREEEQLFGQTAEARKISAAQTKIDAEARQFLATQIKQGRQFSQQELRDIRDGIEARKESVAAIMGEQQALAGAAQLRAENLRFAAEMIGSEKVRAQALIEIDAQVWRERIRLAGEGTAAQMQLQKEFNQWYANQLIKPQIEQQRELWRGIESTAHDTFVSIADGGKDAAARLKDSFKNIFFEWLYQQTLKKWVVQLSPEVAGGEGGLSSLLGTAGASSGGSGALGSAMNLLSIGKTIYSGFAGGIATSLGSVVTTMGETFGSAAMTSFGNGLYGGAGSAMSGAAGAGASASSAIPVIGWIIAGMNMSNSLYKQGWDFNNGSVNKLGQNLGSGINLVDQLARKLGLSDSAANIISGLAPVSKLFGRKNPEITEQGITGTLSANGFAGSSYADILEKGGWFRSDKRYTLTSAITGDQDEAFDSTMSAMVAAVKGFGAAVGAETIAIDGYNKAIKVTLGSDEEANQKAIAAMFTGVADDLATLLVPSIAQFTAEGETASTTLQRVATDFANVTTIFDSIGVSGAAAFGAVGVATIEARERLIALAGGIDTLASQTDFFATNFLTEAEQLAPVQKAVNEQLAALGYAGIATTAQFKAAVLDLASSGKLATESGATTYEALLALAPAFKTVADAADAAATKAEELAAKRGALEGQLYDLTHTPAEALARQRAAELAAMDESLRPIQELIYARQDEVDALKANEDALRSFVDASLDAVTRAVSAEKEAVTTAYQDAMTELGDSIEAVNASIAKTSALSSMLKSALSGMSVQGMESQTRAAAQAQVTAALAIAKAGGELPDADSLSSAVALAAKSSTDDFASFLDYQRDYAKTAGTLAELAGLTGRQMTAEQKQLQLLEDQKDAMTAAYEDELERLEELADKAQEQVDALNGINTSVLSVAQAVGLLAASIAGAKSGATTSNPGGTGLTLEQLYQTALGRAPDAAGYAYWSAIFGDSIDEDEIKNFINGAKAELAGRVPGFAGGGLHSGGWRVVGERGPELEYTPPSRIFSNSASSDLFGRMNERLQALESVFASGLGRLIGEAKRTSDAVENMDTRGISARDALEVA